MSFLYNSKRFTIIIMIIPSIPINALMFSNHSILFSWHECRFFVFFTNLHAIFQPNKDYLSHLVSWEPEGRYCSSKMFRWEPEGRYCCTKSMAIAPFWFSTEHFFSAIAPFWLSADDLYYDSVHKLWSNFAMTQCTLKHPGQCEKWVHRGRTQFQVKSYPEFVHLSADLKIKMSD